MRSFKQLSVVVLLGGFACWAAACANGGQRGLQPLNDGGVDAALHQDAASQHDTGVVADAMVPLDGAVDAGDPCVPSEHVFTDTAESFTVPQNVRYMLIKAWGSGANEEEQCVNNTGMGGPGGYTAAVLDVSASASLVTAGTTLSVVVGRRVHLNETSTELALHGFAASGGGGLSGVFTGAFPLTASEYSRALLIAGGGGSAGSENASTCTIGRPGNNSSAGGMTNMQGGAGDHDNLNGGGGGYRGGLGGAWGLSGYGGEEFVRTHDDVKDSRVESQTQGTWTAPMTSDPDYNGTAGASQEPGLVVIRFVCTLPSL